MQFTFSTPTEEPNRPKVQVVRRSICDDWGTPGFVDNFNVKNVSTIQEGLDFHGLELSHLRPTLIQAPTGFGKSHFVLHNLLPRMKKAGGQMLLLSNRIAISVQQKREIMALTGFPDSACYTDVGVRNLTDFGCIQVMTIQSLPSFLNTAEGRDWCQKVTVLVVDECHFFTADALFNPYCNLALEKITKYFTNATRLYLTATPDHVIGPIAKTEEATPPPTGHRCLARNNPWMERKRFQFVRFNVGNYDHVTTFYFKKLATLEARIAATPHNERWLIFVTSKVQGQELAGRLGADAQFISAEEKQGTAWESLMQAQKLPCRILVTTSVLDCGVNIHDDNLKHVVVLFEDKVSFLQALGRKRCKQGEQFSLYVQRLEPQRRALLSRSNREQLSIIDRLEAGEEEHTALAYLWNHGSDGERMLFQPPWGKNLRENKMAVFALRLQEEGLGRLREATEEYGDSGLPRIVHQWLGQGDGYDETHWLEYNGQQEARTQLQAFLSEYLNRPLVSEADKDAFRSNLIPFHERLAVGKRRADRKGALKHTALSNMLEEMNVPYTLTLSNRSWILEKNNLDEEEDTYS